MDKRHVVVPDDRQRNPNTIARPNNVTTLKIQTCIQTHRITFQTFRSFIQHFMSAARANGQNRNHKLKIMFRDRWYFAYFQNRSPCDFQCIHLKRKKITSKIDLSQNERKLSAFAK